MHEELRERFQRQFAESLALREQLLLERRLLRAKTLQQLTAIEVGRTLEGCRRALGDEALELGYIHVHGVHVQRDGVALDEERPRLRDHRFSEREERLS